MTGQDRRGELYVRTPSVPCPVTRGNWKGRTVGRLTVVVRTNYTGQDPVWTEEEG